MSVLRRFARALSLVAVTLVGVTAPATANAHGGGGGGDDDDRVDVDQVSFPVRLSDGHTYQITGYLYHRGRVKGRTIQVAVHGATHWHEYWDHPRINGISYSYARYMAQRDNPVLAIDQLGTGASSQPDGDFVTLDETASALHQVLVSLRNRHNPTNHKWKNIALVGHSNGSLTSVYETGTYHDADALVTTAFEHTPHPLPFDPAAILSVLTTPYIPATAFSKGFWIGAFYHVPSTDLALVDYEYAHLGPAVQARAQFLDLFRVGLNPTLTRSVNVTVPVLVQTGDFDALQPSAYLSTEPNYYPAAPSVTLTYLTEMGHDVNGHRNHLQSWTRIEQFLDDKLGHGHGDDDCDD